MEKSNSSYTSSIWRKISHSLSTAIVFLFFIFSILIWEGICRGFRIPLFILPPPSTIVYAFVNQILSKMIFVHLYATLVEICWGYVIGSLLGLVLGILVGEIKILERILYPCIVSFQALPKVAIAPLIVLWFGFGLGSKIILVVIVCFFPIVANTIAGMHSTSQDLILMMRSIPATRWQIFKMVKFRSSLPYIFAGLDVAATLSVIGAIVGEFVGSVEGLGNLVLHLGYNFDIGGMFSVFIILAFIGLLMHFVVVYFQRKFVFWT